MKVFLKLASGTSHEMPWFLSKANEVMVHMQEILSMGPAGEVVPYIGQHWPSKEEKEHILFFTFPDGEPVRGCLYPLCEEWAKMHGGSRRPAG